MPAPISGTDTSSAIAGTTLRVVHLRPPAPSRRHSTQTSTTAGLTITKNDKRQLAKLETSPETKKPMSAPIIPRQ